MISKYTCGLAILLFASVYALHERKRNNINVYTNYVFVINPKEFKNNSDDNDNFRPNTPNEDLTDSEIDNVDLDRLQIKLLEHQDAFIN